MHSNVFVALPTRGETIEKGKANQYGGKLATVLVTYNRTIESHACIQYSLCAWLNVYVHMYPAVLDYLCTSLYGPYT